MSDKSVPKSIIEYYAPYKNSKTKFKTSYILGATKFEIDERFEIIDSIGQGAYGYIIYLKNINYIKI